nr:MAG TPA: hypothetical protein [Caudoviricetes sp.]
MKINSSTLPFYNFYIFYQTYSNNEYFIKFY